MKASLWMKYVQRRGMNNCLVQHPLNLINNKNWQAEKSHPPIMDENMTFAVGSKTSVNSSPKNLGFFSFIICSFLLFSSNDPSKGGWFFFSLLFLGFQLSTLVFLHFGFSSTQPEAETKSPNFVFG
jgi:hypothetical protein